MDGAGVCTALRIPLPLMLTEATGAGTDGTLIMGEAAGTVLDGATETGVADNVGCGVCT